MTNETPCFSITSNANTKNEMQIRYPKWCENETRRTKFKHEKEMFMNNSIWPLTMPPPPPQGIPPGICKFFRCWWSIFPSPGTQKETIPHPWGPDRPHMHIFWVHLFETNIVFRTIAKRDIFITLFNVFYLEKDNKCIMWINMNNKFENEKSQRKNPKGPIWHDHSY